MSENKKQNSTIALNKKALYEYHIEERFEAGLVLEGWEVKSLRAGKTQLVDSYVLLKNGEAWLIGMHITPLNTTSTHVKAVPDRTRKLLMKGQGYTLIPLDLHGTKSASRSKFFLFSLIPHG